MVKEPKIGELYYFMQENKILCGAVKKIYGDGELLLLDSTKDGNLYLMESSLCYEYLNDLCDDSLDLVRELKEWRERIGEC